MINQKGFAIIAIPLILAAIGLFSTGVVANIDYEKSQAIKRDQIRVANVYEIKNKLIEHYSVNKSYPIVKKTNAQAQEALKEFLGELPNDPLAAKGLYYGYWSGDGLAFTLVYFSEANHHFEVVFSD